MSYPQYRATTSGYKTFKLIDASTRTIIQIDGSGDFYAKVGLTTISESDVLTTTVAISETDFDGVIDDVSGCARLGHRPHITPH